MRSALIWGVLALICLVPIIGAAQSPLLQWREPVYIAAGFAGIVGLVLLLVQQLLALRILPGLTAARSRQVHRLSGQLLVLSVFLHVLWLWMTSPFDVLDALVFEAPTAFSEWGVIAMWAVFATALLGLFGRKAGLRWQVWTWAHRLLGAFIAVTTILHVLPIEGTMDQTSKVALSGLILLAALAVLLHLPLRGRSAPPR